MKFGILLAMVLVASTALIDADRAVNAFLSVYGNDDSRTPFGNHAFAECNNLIFDACAGPVLGKTRSDYLSLAIDSSTPAEAPRAGGITDIRVETFKIE